jgi:hypothetical protein
MLGEQEISNEFSRARAGWFGTILAFGEALNDKSGVVTENGLLVRR